MTPVGQILRDEIARSGPVRFHRFMELALYHPEYGYYCRGIDPFGKDGDFYTAEQIQPTFGILIAKLIRGLAESDGMGRSWSVVELGAGRADMAEHFTGLDYIAVEKRDHPPRRVSGVVFANEFFDALPVDVAVRRGADFRLMRVGWRDDSFHWLEGEPATGRAKDFLSHYAATAADGAVVEVNLDALDWIERISVMLEFGYLLAIDYGYMSKELARFPSGTLMSYRNHRALEDVLTDPGARDLTAHVNLSALSAHATACGMEAVRTETMGRMILRAGEDDEFACLFEGVTDSERSRRMLQLKSLMFGMGETFLAVLFRRGGRAK